MDITSTMQQTLQGRVNKVSGVSNRTDGLRVDFWNSTMVALHLGTPKETDGDPIPVNNGLTVIE